MYSSFRSFVNGWLKENHTNPDTIDDILLGVHIGPQIKTTCIKESHLKKTPYHVYYKYKTASNRLLNTEQTDNLLGNMKNSQTKEEAAVVASVASPGLLNEAKSQK